MPEEKIFVRDLRNGGWYWVHKIVYEEYAKKIGAEGLGIYNALCYYANKSKCYPSLTTMQEKLNMSPPTLLKHLKILQREKLIKIESHKKQGRANIYWLLKVEGIKKLNTPIKKVYTSIKNFNTHNITIINNKNKKQEDFNPINLQQIRDFRVKQGWIK